MHAIMIMHVQLYDPMIMKGLPINKKNVAMFESKVAKQILFCTTSVIFDVNLHNIFYVLYFLH